MSDEPKYPKGETVWTRYQNADHELMFILTSKPDRSLYYLYELADGAFKKLGKAKEPPDLLIKYKVLERIHGK